MNLAKLNILPPLKQAAPAGHIALEVPEGFPLIPDADYTAICTGYETAQVFKGLRIFFHFRVTEGPYTGTMLFRAYRVLGSVIPGKGPGTGIRYRLHRRSDCYKMLCRVLQLPGNTKAHLLWPRELVNKLCRIKTRTVTHDSRQKPLAEGERYSTIAEILSCVAG